MKNGIIKIWVCTECGKEHLDRPIMCRKCERFDFDVKYGGQIADAKELSKLIETYKEKDLEKSKRIRM